MNILHLTDLHFSTEDDEWETAKKWSRLFRAVHNETAELAIDEVAVTGDFTSHGAAAEFAQAEWYLSELSALLNISRSHFWFCRGNHDADSGDSGASFSHYERFAADFFAHTGREKSSLGVHAINTCSKTSLTDFDNAVVLREEAERVRCDCEQHEENILLMHHQLEVIKNPEMLDILTGKVSLVLSGHLHPEAPRLSKSSGIIYVTGMAVTPHLPAIPSGFQLVRAGTDGIGLRSCRI